jgi:tRNA-specific 2-thiouridylase
VLWGLDQACLSRSIYPLGDLLKTEVRQYAFDKGYVELSKKSESYEICFVPDNDYRGFLKRSIPNLEQDLTGGLFVSTSGQILGKHQGYPFYTIGQRKGLGVAFGKPMFVVKIIPETNTVVLGDAHELEAQEMMVKGINYIKYSSIEDGTSAITKIRYKDAGAISTLSNIDQGINVHFDHAVHSIAPGQSAVFYEGDDVLGGGIIQSGVIPF